MENRFKLKYQRILEIISKIAECTGDKVILVGGTALALFYFNHRVSVDLDFVPKTGDQCDRRVRTIIASYRCDVSQSSSGVPNPQFVNEEEIKQEIKGCLTKKGLRTTVGRYRNQFIIQFEDTSIKIEIFNSEYKIKNIIEKDVGGKKILIASLDDLLDMKIIAYSERRKPRDLYDIIAILINKKLSLSSAIQLVNKNGLPVESDELDYLATDQNILSKYKEVISNASKTGNNI